MRKLLNFPYLVHILWQTPYSTHTPVFSQLRYEYVSINYASRPEWKTESDGQKRNTKAAMAVKWRPADGTMPSIAIVFPQSGVEGELMIIG